MEEQEPIRNKVAESDIRVFNLESLWDGLEVVELDLAPWLFKQLVLKEKDFRESIRQHDWSQYDGRHVAVYCSTDAILPTWASMLVATRLAPIAASVSFGRSQEVVRDHFEIALARVDWSEYADAPVVIKGCASRVVPQSAYVSATVKLQSVAAKLMFGEPCSAVPLWRRKSQTDKQGNDRSAGVRPVAIPADFQK